MCWGAYVANEQIFLEATTGRKPTLVGALSPIRPRDANRLQLNIVRTLRYCQNYESQLLDLVRDRNVELRDDYHEDPFRIVCPSGVRLPDIGGGRLAEPFTSRQQYRVVAAPLPGTHVVAQHASGALWSIPAAPLNQQNRTEDLQSLLGKVFEFRAKKSTPTDGSLSVGRLVELRDLTVPPRSSWARTFRRAYKPPYDNCWQAAYEIPAPTVMLRRKPCLKCNGATMKWVRVHDSAVFLGEDWTLVAIDSKVVLNTPRQRNDQKAISWSTFLT